MAKAILGLVDSEFQTKCIVDALKAAAFSNDDISILYPDKSGPRDFAHERHTKAPEGAAAGAGTGAAVGGVLGWLIGIGSLAIPGFGPFIAAGPIMAALAGIGAGAALGGLSGALVGMGIPEFEAKLYEGKIMGGNVLISVHFENRDEWTPVKEIFELHGAHDIAFAEAQHVVKRYQANSAP